MSPLRIESPLKTYTECMNDKVILRNYVPPQYYNRYIAISAACAELRKTTDNLNTDEICSWGHSGSD